MHKIPRLKRNKNGQSFHLIHRIAHSSTYTKGTGVIEPMANQLYTLLEAKSQSPKGAHGVLHLSAGLFKL